MSAQLIQQTIELAQCSSSVISSEANVTMNDAEEPELSESGPQEALLKFGFINGTEKGHSKIEWL